MNDLRLPVYDALEESSHLTVQELAERLSNGAQISQAQVRAVLRAEPEVFWPEEDRWDLAIFHRFEAQHGLFRGRGGQPFDPDKFLRLVLDDALRLKSWPIDLMTLTDKYLRKIARSARLRKDEFPTQRQEVMERLQAFLGSQPRYHLLCQDECQWVWTEPAWPEERKAMPEAAYVLPSDFLDRAAELLSKRHHEPARLLTVLETVLQIDTNHPDFPAAFALANASLSADAETFVRVREDAWMLASGLPAHIEDIPARVAIPRWRNPQEERLIKDLYTLPGDALAEAADFADEDEAETAAATFDESYVGPLRLILPYHWRQAGILKANRSERRLFPDSPARVYLQFRDRTENKPFPAWLNNDTGYLYGLKDWYTANLVPAGGIFYVERSRGSKYEYTVWVKEAQAHTFDDRQYFCEVDADTYIEEDRLRDLEALRAKVEAAQATIKDVICDLFAGYPSEMALHYRQVWAQVHVIRPTTRRTVAAILSTFPCFYQVEPRSGRWLYAPVLRDMPPKQYVAKQPAPRPKPIRPQEEVATLRPARRWLVPVRAADWAALARPSGSGEGVFLVPWRGRSRVARDDQLAFYDAGSARIIAAAEVLREPVQDPSSGRREVTVRPLLPVFSPVPYADVAGALSVPQPEPDGYAVEITPEDLETLRQRLQPLVAPKSEPTIEELIEQALPKQEAPVAEEIIPHTYGPNPTIGAFIARYGQPYDSGEIYERSAFAYPVKAARSGTIYDAHPYHTKVPPQGIEPYIEHYTRPGDVVLDPFCGTGMTGVAALKLGRHVILSDLSPAATHITYNYCMSVDVAALRREFERVKTAVRDEFDWLYGTTCDRCGGPATIQYTIWSEVYQCQKCANEIVYWDTAVDFVSGTIRDLLECPHCGSVWSKGELVLVRAAPVVTNYHCEQCKPHQTSHRVTPYELDLLHQIDATKIKYWYPQVPFDSSWEMWRAVHGNWGITDVSKFFTRRNLMALARLWHEISETQGERIQRALQFMFTSLVYHHGTIMTRMILKGGGKPVLTSTMSGTLYIPALPVEKNVLQVMTRKAQDISDAFRATAGFPESVVITTQSASNLGQIPDSTVDYVFTDPPFGSNIFYADCSLIWESWLSQGLTDQKQEAVVHVKHKNKNTLPDYTRLMMGSFREVYRVLKPGRWASVVFHNSDDRVWQAIQHAAEAAGFDLVNAMVFDKEQRSFKGIRGEKGLENVTNFDIVLNLHKKVKARPVAQPEAQERIEQVIVAAIREHLEAGPAPDYRTGQYLHSLAIRALLNARISVELTWERLESILNVQFRHINCHWYLSKEAITSTGHGFMVRSESTAVAWLEHVLATNPQTLSDLIPQWQIATLGAGSRISRTLEQILDANFWKEEATGYWTVPTSAQREIIKRRRPKHVQLQLGLENDGGPQTKLGL